VREHEARPLDVDEIARLRTIAQELTRTDPGLLRVPGPRDGGCPDRRRVGAYLAVMCVLIGTLAVTLDAVPALVTGAALLVVGTAAVAAGRRSLRLPPGEDVR
jgi:hypothetical protein